MYHFKGTLVVKKIHGRYGEFAVGSIQSPIGDFSVKQKELDQFEEGIYQGKFTISNIQASTSSFGSNKLILENRAELAAIHIDVIDETEVEETTEVDPITEDKDVELKEVNISKSETNDEDLLNLFDEEQIKNIQNKSDVVLDPTNRMILRQQTAYLKSKKWKFNMQKQLWYLPQ